MHSNFGPLFCVKLHPNLWQFVLASGWGAILLLLQLLLLLPLLLLQLAADIRKTCQAMARPNLLASCATTCLHFAPSA